MKYKWLWIVLAVPIGLILIIAGFVLITRLLVFDSTISLPKFPQELQVYKTVKPEITAEYVAALGASWGLTGEVKRYETGFGLKDTEKQISLNVALADGYIAYHTADQPSVKSPTLPSYKEAATIASNFLNQAGLLKAEMKPYSVGIRSTAGGIPQGLYVSLTSQVDINDIFSPGNQRDAANDFYFAGGSIAVIDNILVPGGSCTVDIGNGGIVTRMAYRPIQYAPWQTVSLKPVDQAYKELKIWESQFKGSIFNPMGRFKGVHFISIDSITIAYCMESGMARREVAYPVYVFKGRSRTIWGMPAHQYGNIISATDAYSMPIRVQY